MMDYIDGFVAAVPTANRERFTKHAQETAAIFKECGARRVVECWGDDVPQGKLTSFPMAVQCKEDETGGFLWIVWASRQGKNAGMKKKEKKQGVEAGKMAFDGQRADYG